MAFSQEAGAENWETLARRFQSKTTLDVLEIINGEKSYRHLSAIEVDAWLNAPCKWPRAQFRIIFIDEDENDTNKMCVSVAALQTIFRAMGISERFLENLSMRSSGTRIVNYDENNQLSWHEFWYSAVFWQLPGPQITHLGKKILHWSFVNVWMGRDVNTGEVRMLILCCPADVKKTLLLKPIDFFRSSLRYPMLIHLYFLRSLAQNHWKILKTRMFPLHEEEQRIDIDGASSEALADRSRNLLSICRQYSAFLLDSDLAQSLLERAIKENDWVSHHPPPQAKENEIKIWKHDCESSAEDLKEVLDGFKTRSRYAQMYEQRAKIGIDESFAVISQHDSATNILMAKRSESNARSLWILQLLALFFLPLSLSTLRHSIFGMGFFSTQPGPNGDAQLVVSGKWWYFLAVALPSTAVMYLSVFGSRLWEVRRDQSKTTGAKV